MVEALVAASSSGRLLTEVESKALLASVGLPVAAAHLVADPTAAEHAAAAVGYPVVLKVVSRDIAHKSDVGGVAIGITSATDLRDALEAMQAKVAEAAPSAHIEGFAVQHMMPAGIEVIVGATTDPQFGPVVMFGLGGVFVEVLKDVAFRVVPLTERDAAEMVREIQGFPILQGVRGQAGADIPALERIIMQVSDLMATRTDIAELDLNPVIAYPDAAVAVDARVVLRVEE